jgi:ferric-dicitrate binding protein FerR (iron transport regulator)
METVDFLPEDDQDLQLAEQLGIALESGEKISSIEHPLIQSLLTFKSQEISHIEDLQKDSSDIWDLIDSKTRTSKKANINSINTRSYNSWAWATAATVLIAAFLGIFCFTSFEESILIAESGDQIKKVTLADGSEISLRPHSSLYEIEVSDQKRAYKVSGEAFFNVSHDEDRPFSVEAVFGEVTVLGTKFNVSTWTGYTTVYLEEGSVRVNNIGGMEAILKPGERIDLYDSTISDPESSSVEQYKDWLNNTLVLNSTSVKEIIQELEHHFALTIDISAFENTSELISGSILLENTDQTLADLGVILGGTFREVNTDSYVFIPLDQN